MDAILLAFTLVQAGGLVGTAAAPGGS